ncbi:MAG TPA: glycosyltransferase [Phycisphaerales bacterium]|nr:glycosyltransferase [Phycisphaerales bacterium]
MKPEISLVIPVYNEQDNLVPLYEKVLQSLVPADISFEMILVDDGSSDRSLDRLRELVDRDPRVVAVELRRNFGQTAAMAAGIDEARGEFVVTLDADLQNDPADIPLMLHRAREGFDIVSGWRKDRQDDFLSRTLPSKIANRLISKITGTFLHDYGCTLKVYRRDALSGLNLYGEMHRFLPALVARTGARIDEMAVNHHPRLHGESKYGIGRTFKVILDLLTVKFLTSYSTKPIYVFGGFGLLLSLLGFATAGIMVYAKLVHGISMILTPLPNLSAMLVILGAQSLMLGLLAELVIRTYHESQNKKIYTIRNVYSVDREE